MKERPILFSGAMVRAILDGRKTQTRRIVSPQPREHYWEGLPGYKEYWTYLHVTEGMLATLYRTIPQNPEPEIERRISPYGGVDGYLWVRETWMWVPDGRGRVVYRATSDELGEHKWKPSIHMSRWLSRITLEVTDIRVERLQDISEDDACAEGTWTPCHCNEGCSICGESYLASFRHVWDAINAQRGFGWDINPWVWVIAFRRIDP